MANQDWTVWEERWKSLSGAMDALTDRYQGSSFSRKTTLQCLVRCLKAFAEKQFYYFYNGFGDPAPSNRFQSSEEYPPEYVFRMTLDQIAYDLEVIQRAAEQRISGSEAMKTALKIADKLAWEALEPVVGQNKLIKGPKTTVVTYFNKSANIRVIPYAPVAMIGIPFTCAPVPHTFSGASPADLTVVAQDYLAIPHEVGHHVYRHSTKVQESILVDLYRKIKDEKRKRALGFFRWVEEIFADIYGCLIAGPWIALDFQDLQLTDSKDRFVKDDREHPVPALRPYIYARVLEKMGLQSWSEELNNHWQTRLTERGNPTRFTLEKPKMPSGLFWDIVSILWIFLGKVSREKALKEMLSIVETVYDSLLHDVAIAQSNWWQSAFPASSPEVILAGEDEEDPYQEFENRLRPLVEAPPDFPSGRELACDELDIDNLWDNWKNSLRPGLRLPRDPLGIIEIEAIIEAIDAGLPPEPDWVDVLHAEGWATKGPHATR